MKRSSFGRLLLALSTAVALDAPAAAQTAGANYAIDPVHSSAEFKVEHLVISNVRGTIPVVSGSFEVPAGSTLPVNAAATLDAAALTTQIPIATPTCAAPTGSTSRSIRRSSLGAPRSWPERPAISA